MYTCIGVNPRQDRRPLVLQFLYHNPTLAHSGDIYRCTSTRTIHTTPHHKLIICKRNINQDIYLKLKLFRAHTPSTAPDLYSMYIDLHLEYVSMLMIFTYIVITLDCCVHEQRAHGLQSKGVAIKTVFMTLAKQFKG